MIVGITIRRCAFDAVIVLLANVQLAADDGLDSRSLGSIHEVHGAKNIAMVGHGNGGHLIALNDAHHLLDVASTIEK